MSLVAFLLRRPAAAAIFKISNFLVTANLKKKYTPGVRG